MHSVATSDHICNILKNICRHFKRRQEINHFLLKRPVIKQGLSDTKNWQSDKERLINIADLVQWEINTKLTDRIGYSLNILRNSLKQHFTVLRALCLHKFNSAEWVNIVYSTFLWKLFWNEMHVNCPPKKIN